MQGRCFASALALVVLLGGVCLGQTMEEKRDAKLAEAWIKKFDWITDYDKALATSAETGKPIFAYFSRSYST